MRFPQPVTTAAFALLLTGCGYFNAMYNAQRRFRDAQRADERGNQTAARTAYLESIEKAGKSYRAHPSGRWADDALLLIGRAWFRLGEYESARAAMTRLLEQTSDRDLRRDAFAHLGASQVALGEFAAGSAALDSATALRASSTVDPFVSLWRARGAFGAGDQSRGWQEIGSAIDAGGDASLTLAARFEMAQRAVSARDSARLRTALASLLRDRATARFVDSLEAVARDASVAWGPAFAYSTLEPATRSDWPADARHRIGLARGAFAAAAGDHASATLDAIRISGSATGPTADRARYLGARWRLATVEATEDLPAVRALLLPAVANAGARELLAALRTLDVLLEFAGERGEPLALFAAAEIARDSLHTPALARSLFLAFADLERETPWAGKALLAALQLSNSPAAADSVRQRIDDRPHDLYLRAITGDTDTGAYAAAEERLSRELIALRFDAGQEVSRRELGVARTVARLDSVRMAARNDSIVARCGERIDSLAIRGIRADSVRAACVRGDSVRVGVLLTIDTLMLRQPRTREDSLRMRGRSGVVRDTIRLPRP